MNANHPRSAVGVETELKLVMAPDVLDRVTALPIIATHARDHSADETLIARYFDTNDRRLLKRGLTFRIRKESGGCVQTVKAASPKTGAALARGEWSVPVDGWAPDPGRFAPAAPTAGPPSGDRHKERGTPDALLRAALKGHALEPVFETDIRRHRRLIDLPAGLWGTGEPSGRGAVIELAIDRGAVAAGNRTAPIAEVELELIEGRPEALYRLAMAMAAEIPVRPSVINKAAIGWRLAAAPAGDPRPDSAPWVAADEPKWPKRKSISADDALAAVVSQCLFHLIANADPARDGVAEGIHQMRVATRRLRAVAALFRSVLPPADRDRLRDGARMIAAALGPARDWDVLQFETLPAGLRGGGDGIAQQDEQACKALVAAVEQRRLAAHRSVAAMIDDGAFGRFTLWLAWWCESREWRTDSPSPKHLGRPVTALASKRLTLQHRKVTKDAALFATLDTEARHAVRKRVKKLRYSVDFFGGLYKKKKVKAYRKALKAIQDRLGAMNDAAVASALLAELCRDPATEANREVGLAAGRVIGWIDRDAVGAIASIDADWVRFKKAKPFWS